MWESSDLIFCSQNITLIGKQKHLGSLLAKSLTLCQRRCTESLVQGQSPFVDYGLCARPELFCILKEVSGIYFDREEGSQGAGAWTAFH